SPPPRRSGAPAASATPPRRCRPGNGPAAGRPHPPRPRTDAAPSSQPRPLPDPRPDVRARLDQHVDQRAVVDPHVVDLRRHAALVQGPPLVDLLAHHVEQRVLLDPFDQLLLVIEGEVGRDRARQLPRTVRLVDERHGASLSYLPTRAEYGRPGCRPAAAT